MLAYKHTTLAWDSSYRAFMRWQDYRARTSQAHGRPVVNRGSLRRRCRGISVGMTVRLDLR
jgi:hypothetical protein